MRKRYKDRRYRKCMDPRRDVDRAGKRGKECALV